MKKLLLIGALLVLITTLKAQTTIFLSEGLDSSPEYLDVDYYIEGTLLFNIRSDGSKYISYDVVSYFDDPLMASIDVFPIDIYGTIEVDGQTVNLYFDNGGITGYLYYGEGGGYSNCITELDNDIEVSDIGMATIYIDYLSKYYVLLLNW